MLSASAVLAPIAPAAQAQTWNGGAGDWGTASNWTPATVPNSSSAVVEIDGKPAVTSMVAVDPNEAYTVGMALNVSGNIVNSGATGSHTQLLAAVLRRRRWWCSHVTSRQVL